MAGSGNTSSSGRQLIPMRRVRTRHDNSTKQANKICRNEVACNCVTAGKYYMYGVTDHTKQLCNWLRVPIPGWHWPLPLEFLSPAQVLSHLPAHSVIWWIVQVSNVPKQNLYQHLSWSGFTSDSVWKYLEEHGIGGFKVVLLESCLILQFHCLTRNTLTLDALIYIFRSLKAFWLNFVLFWLHQFTFFEL